MLTPAKSEVLPEPGVPGEGGVDPPGVLPEAFFIVEMEGCGVFFYDLVQLRSGDKGSLHRRYLVSWGCRICRKVSSNNTLAEEYRMADRLGAIINLDDLTHVDFLEEAIVSLASSSGR